MICGLGIDRGPYEETFLPANATTDQEVAHYSSIDQTLFYVLICLSVLLMVLLTSNFYLLGHMVGALIFSQRRHLQRSIANQVSHKNFRRPIGAKRF